MKEQIKIKIEKEPVTLFIRKSTLKKLKTYCSEKEVMASQAVEDAIELLLKNNLEDLKGGKNNGTKT